MGNTIKMELLNALLILSINGPSLENKNEVLKIVKTAVANYESLDLLKNIIVGKYNANKKSDVAIQIVIDLKMEKNQQNTEAALENLEQEYNKKYIQILSMMKVAAQKKMKMTIDLKAFILNIKWNKYYFINFCVVVFFKEISSDIILSAINPSQADESSFPKYKSSIFFKQTAEFLSKGKDYSETAILGRD